MTLLALLLIPAGLILLTLWAICACSAQAERRAERLMLAERTRRQRDGTCPCWRHAAQCEERY